MCHTARLPGAKPPPLVSGSSRPHLSCGLWQSLDWSPYVTEPSRSLSRVLTIGVLLALLLLPQSARPEDEAHPPQQAQADQHKHDEGKAADKATDTDQLPPASTTQHSVTLGGTTFSYSATAGTIPLHNP